MLEEAARKAFDLPQLLSASGKAVIAEQFYFSVAAVMLLGISGSGVLLLSKLEGARLVAPP